MATDFSFYIKNSNYSFSDIEKLMNNIGLPLQLGSEAQSISPDPDMGKSREHILNYDFFTENEEDIYDRLYLYFSQDQKDSVYLRTLPIDTTTPHLTHEFFYDERLNLQYDFHGYIGAKKIEFIVNKLVQIIHLITNDIFLTYTIGDSDYMLILEKLEGKIRLVNESEIEGFEELKAILNVFKSLFHDI